MFIQSEGYVCIRVSLPSASTYIYGLARDIVPCRRSGLLLESKIGHETLEKPKRVQLGGFQEYEPVAPSEHILFHLFYWAHFKGHQKVISLMDTDQTEKFLQTIDIRLPEPLDILEDCAKEHKKRLRPSDDTICSAKEARKRDNIWKLLREFDED